MGTAGETACPTLLDQSFGRVGGAGGFACRWKLISIAHPNPENGYAPDWPPTAGACVVHFKCTHANIYETTAVPRSPDCADAPGPSPLRSRGSADRFLDSEAEKVLAHRRNQGFGVLLWFRKCLHGYT